ncbi:MAG TPA: hypothetical protein VK885_11160, partial [Desulfotignum sp.]|nr:hypothetical protein [Desulfotignum sp.]
SGKKIGNLFRAVRVPGHRLLYPSSSVRPPHKYAVRIYSGRLKINQVQILNGKAYSLLNLPFYLTGSISEYLKRMISNDKSGHQSK